MGAITRGRKRAVGWPADQSGSKRGARMLKAKKVKTKAKTKPTSDDDTPNYRGGKKKRPRKG